jgi:hypothetical protein
MTFSLDEFGRLRRTGNMVHRAGSKVVLARSAQVPGPSLLQVMPGRVATLNCDNLIVQFSESANAKARQRKRRPTSGSVARVS